MLKYINMPKEFGNLLKNLDLTNVQIKIYLSVLKNGMSSVLDISKETKINRSQIYLDTSILLEKGFLELATKKTRNFLAISPLRIKSIIESKNKKLEELQNVLSEADQFFSKSRFKNEDEFEVKIYEGISQIKKAFNLELEDSLNTKSKIYSLVGDFNHQYSFLSEDFWKKWNLKFKDGDGYGYMLVDKQDAYFNQLRNGWDMYQNVEIRGAENFKLKSNIDIWGDKVLIVTFSKNPKAVLITSKILAESYRDIFERLWNIAK
jgi:predicted transcriptional regulator